MVAGPFGEPPIQMTSYQTGGGHWYRKAVAVSFREPGEYAEFPLDIYDDPAYAWLRRFQEGLQSLLFHYHPKM